MTAVVSCHQYRSFAAKACGSGSQRRKNQELVRCRFEKIITQPSRYRSTIVRVCAFFEYLQQRGFPAHCRPVEIDRLCQRKGRTDFPRFSVPALVPKTSLLLIPFTSAPPAQPSTRSHPAPLPLADNRRPPWCRYPPRRSGSHGRATGIDAGHPDAG